MKHIQVKFDFRCGLDWPRFAILWMKTSCWTKQKVCCVERWRPCEVIWLVEIHSLSFNTQFQKCCPAHHTVMEPWFCPEICIGRIGNQTMFVNTVIVPIKNPFLIRLIVKLADNTNSITFLNAWETPESNFNHFSISLQGKLTERIRLWSPVGELELNYNAWIEQRPLSQTIPSPSSSLARWRCHLSSGPSGSWSLPRWRTESGCVCGHMCANRCVFHLVNTSTSLPIQVLC